MRSLPLNIEWREFCASRVLFGFNLESEFSDFGPDIAGGRWGVTKLVWRWNWHPPGSTPNDSAWAYGNRPWHRCWKWNTARELND